MTTHKHALTLGYKHTERECGLKPRLCVCVCVFALYWSARAQQKKERKEQNNNHHGGPGPALPCPAAQGRTNERRPMMKLFKHTWTVSEKHTNCWVEFFS